MTKREEKATPQSVNSYQFEDKYQKIITLDGSETLYHKAFDEAMHSTAGAREETMLHYWHGCHMPELFFKKKSVQLLDVGLGLGLGASVCLEEMQKLEEQEIFLRYLSFELDEELVSRVADNYLAPWIKQRIKESGRELWKGNNFEATILIGDARETLPRYLAEVPWQFDAIFQDAFSPRRNPTLWTTEWFSLLAKYSSSQCHLSTYSASSRMRKSMMMAGWGVSKGPGFGPKKQSTRATLGEKPDPEIESLVASEKLRPNTDIEYGIIKSD